MAEQDPKEQPRRVAPPGAQDPEAPERGEACRRLRADLCPSLEGAAGTEGYIDWVICRRAGGDGGG